MALLDVIDAIDQLRQRAFPSTGLTNDGDSLAWFSAERDVFQDGSVAIAEGDILEDDLAAHLLAVAVLVLVEFSLLAQYGENALRSRYAQLDEVE